MKKLIVKIFISICLIKLSSCQRSPIWTYECIDSLHSIGGHEIQARCVQKPFSGAGIPNGLNKCKMTCGKFGILWPQPTGETRLGKSLDNFYPSDLTVQFDAPSGPTSLLREFWKIFKVYLLKYHPEYEDSNLFGGQQSTNRVHVNVHITSNDTNLTVDTDESYEVTIDWRVGKNAEEQGGTNVYYVDVSAKTYFGARHGLETLSQLISYDELSNSLQIYREAYVKDSPKYPHRGLSIDTSRNYVSVKVIKSIIDAMSYNKLNVFHWHITDTHSFPLVMTRVPELTEYGAYAPHKVYSKTDIKKLIQYARIRGVKILPEFDAPAHVGNGWQFGEKKGLGKLAVCVNQEPWQDYCVEPPCGQLNPVNENMYNVLGNVYKDFFDTFGHSDMFHMGGDEINLNCWNSTNEIKEYLKGRGEVGTEKELLNLWDHFQKKAQKLVYEANGNNTLPLILWTNRLMEKGEADEYLNNKDYVIQIWSTGKDDIIPDVINKGYRTIFSNYDAWYFDCGYAGWVTDGVNWCSPYKGWQLVYDNSPRGIYKNFTDQYDKDKENSILGGEACMWSEQVDGFAIQSKLWPRGAALGERLWADPENDWQGAEFRMIHNRERMVGRGIGADALQPEWCHQNEGLCYLRKEEKKEEL